jgi:hypothetical protein
MNAPSKLIAKRSRSFCYPYIKDDPLLNDLHDQREYAGLLESARKSHEEFRNRFLS